MSHDATDEARPVTSVELLNAAVWREIGWEEPQTPAAFVVGVVSGRLRINGRKARRRGFIGRCSQSLAELLGLRETGVVRFLIVVWRGAPPIVGR